MTKQMIYVLLGILISAGLSIAAKTRASADTSSRDPDRPATMSGELYHPSSDPMADLAAKLASARAGNKRLLVVLGANWCHDSRALATRLNTAPLSAVIDAGYETLFVDVGYLDKGRDVIASLGVPVYYATPTVLIVDPASGRVINLHNRHQWAQAASISMDTSVEYFSQFANAGQTGMQAEENAYLQTLLTEIAVFEQAQAERLYRAYAVVGPMLKAYKEGDEAAFSDQLWNEVRDYRFKVPDDLESLRVVARERVAAGETGIELVYPVYPAFSWERQ